MNYSTLLKVELVKRGLKNEEISRQIGMNSQQFSSVSSGKLSCPHHWQIALSRYLDIPVNNLFDEIGRA
jgi:hypothetical protein